MVTVGSFLCLKGMHSNIINNKKRISVNGYHHQIEITLENEDIMSTVLKSLIKINKVDVGILNIRNTEVLTIKTQALVKEWTMEANKRNKDKMNEKFK